jgi:multidrug efflux system membrane fusion protein
MKKTFWIIFLLALALLGGWFFWHRHQTASADAAGSGTGGRGRGPGGPTGPVPVVAAEVGKKDVPIFLDGLGTVQAFNSVTIRSRVDGQLDKIAFTEGQEVKAGDLLAVIDPRPFQSGLAQAEAKARQDEAQLANAQAILARNTELLKKGALDKQTFDTSKFQADQLQAAVQADRSALENAQTQLSYTQIKSPIAGRVGVRQVDAGNIIHAGDPNGLVVITQLRPISVVFTLPQQELQSVLEKSGEGTALPVRVFDRGNTRALGEGTLAVIDNQIDQGTGTVKLKATFPNEDQRLWPGQFVNARLLLTTRKGGTVVPSSAVQRGPNGTYAYVIKADKTVEMRAIKVIQSEANEALIENGLTPGEQVVVDGQYKLQPGSQVELTTPGAPTESPGEGRGKRGNSSPGAKPQK